MSYCTKHESHDCVYCERDELQRRIDAAEGQNHVGTVKVYDSPADDVEWLFGIPEHGAKLYLKPFPAPAHISLLREAAALFRRYESHHRAKGGEADEKAEVNRVIAERIESVLNEVNHGQG